MIYTTEYNSPVGRIMIAAKDEALTGLWIENQKYYPASVKEEMKQCDDLAVLVQAKDWLDRYFAGEKPQIRELNLAPVGSEFRRAVWELLTEIPYGEVTTYGKIAGKVAKSLVGTNGSLTGYAGGIDKKIALLTHEGISMDRFFVPKKGTAL